MASKNPSPQEKKENKEIVGMYKGFAEPANFNMSQTPRKDSQSESHPPLDILSYNILQNPSIKEGFEPKNKEEKIFSKRICLLCDNTSQIQNPQNGAITLYCTSYNKPCHEAWDPKTPCQEFIDQPLGIFISKQRAERHAR